MLRDAESLLLAPAISMLNRRAILNCFGALWLAFSLAIQAVAATQSGKRPGSFRTTSREAAETAEAQASALLETQTVQTNRTAIEKYAEALSYWRSAGESAREAVTLSATGEIYNRLTESKKAIEYFDRALSLARQRNNTRLEAEIMNRMIYSYLNIGENQKASQLCSRALQLSRDIAHKTAEAAALNNMGEVEYAFGNLLAALEHYHAALSLFRLLKDKEGEAQSLLYVGYSYADLGELSKALDLYNQALALYRSSGNRRGQALALIAIGHYQHRVGEDQQAFNLYEQALPMIQAVGDRIWEGSIIISTGAIYKRLGDEKKALAYFERALRLFQAVGYPKGEISALSFLGEVYQSQGSTDRALSCYRSALAIARRVGDQRLEPSVLKRIGIAYESLGDSRSALDYYLQAQMKYHAGGDRRAEAYALNSIGDIHCKSGETSRGLEYFNRAVVLNRATRDLVGEASTLSKIARAERDLGDLPASRAHIEAGLDAIETLRTKVASHELRSSFFATVRQHYDLYIDLLMKSGGERAVEFRSRALQISERIRARSLIEMLAEARADIRQGVDTALLERERMLQKTLTDKEARYSRLLAGKHTEGQAAGALSEIEGIRTSYQQVQASIRTTSPRYAALTQPQPLTLKEIQEQVLDSETLLLEYSLGDERSYLWAVTTGSLATFELPSRAEIEKAARRVYDLLTAPNQVLEGESELQRERRLARADVDFWPAAAALSKMVIGPVSSQLGTKRLLIVADGALQYVPFAALAAPSVKGIAGGSQSSGGQGIVDVSGADFKPLILDHEIVNLPSASTLAVMRRELAGRGTAQKAVAVLADPVFSRLDPRVNASRLPVSRPGAATISKDFQRALKEVPVSRNRSGVTRLPFSRAEAAAIKAAAPVGKTLVAVDFDASRATAMSDQLSQYRIIHFATHGLLNSEHPELSGLVFSLVDRQGKPQNGFLRLHEVYNLNLPAELVVLSACQTGLGKDVKGEGLVGLTRGFMYAGAARVMASLWQVDDLATAELMKLFYANMLGDGMRPAAALRDAQVEMWKQKQWRAPYYWAGFTLQGEWK
jgi:CHAT domain-containing protein/tetratricopeptide (TPR) repeat protein